MQGMLITLKADGTISPDHVDTAQVLDKLKAAVGGYIETVPFWTSYRTHPSGPLIDCVVYCNEHGKLNNLPLNANATRLWTYSQIEQGRPPLDDVLCGDVVVVYGDEEFMEAL